MYINSPGGSVSATLAMYDTIKHIKPDVSTICVGMAASGAAVILAAGAKSKRFALPNAEVMIHQLMGGAEGQATEIEITARHMIKIKDRLNKILSDATGQPIKKSGSRFRPRLLYGRRRGQKIRNDRFRS